MTAIGQLSRQERGRRSVIAKRRARASRVSRATHCHMKRRGTYGWHSRDARYFLHVAEGSIAHRPRPRQYKSELFFQKVFGSKIGLTKP